MPEPTPEQPPTASPLEDTQDLSDAVVTLETDLPQRKPWWNSWKVRCCWIASFWPISAGAAYIISAWSDGRPVEVPMNYVWGAMVPWLTLAFGELGHDAIKVWHEWKAGVRG